MIFGGGNYNKILNDGKGTSLVLVNTKEGEKLFNIVGRLCEKVNQMPIDCTLSGNGTLTHPTVVNPKRVNFWKKYSELTLAENLNNLLEDSADCAIINYWYANSHGAVLTAYALQQVLADLGYSSKLLNICPEGYREKRPGGISQKLELKYLNSTYEIYNTSTLPSLNDKFIYFLVGLEQVFRAEWVGDDWFLQFVELNKPKIAVAASFGTDELSVSKERRKRSAYLLNRFNTHNTV